MTVRLIYGTSCRRDNPEEFVPGDHEFLVSNGDGTTQKVLVAVREVWMPYRQPVGFMFSGQSEGEVVVGHFDPVYGIGYFTITP